MKNQNQIVAEQTAFRGFLNSYLREIDPGRPVFHRVGTQNADCVELRLARRGVSLRVEMASRSLCGMHHFGRAWLLPQGSSEWRDIEPTFALHLLILAATPPGAPPQREAELELLERVLLSYSAMRRYLDAAPVAPIRPAFIEAEQSLYFGHPLHPTPKSLQGMAEWQQAAYAPEFRSAFQLVYFAAHNALVRQDSAGESPAQIATSMLGSDADTFSLAPYETILPQHPLQAQALLLEPKVQELIRAGKLRHLGAAGPMFTATSSVRTVYSADTGFMPKFSLPVRITNSKRVNKRHELHDAVAVARFFDKAGLNEFDPRLSFMHDLAYLTLDLPGQPESGFEVLFRENSLMGRPDAPIVTVSALTAEPKPGQQSLFASVIRDASRVRNLSPQSGCRRWFSAYLDCVLDPTFGLYDRFGVALEAHQQNSLLDLSADGFPVRLIYRDSQGFYLSNAFRQRWSSLVPDLSTTENVFYDDRDIRERFAYYLVVNQIFAVIARAGHDGLATEADLLAMLRARLRRIEGELTGPARELVGQLLDLPYIAAKANLITRLRDVDELVDGGGAVYTRFANPLSAVGMALASETLHAIAS